MAEIHDKRFFPVGWLPLAWPLGEVFKKTGEPKIDSPV
ncbi:hypothetical protein X474_15045 [Dethiosulfatarculus sandiegensis]|uniref:Uncharacterized protein n=1 Tax=Dethiosulfatarculus sandiegensis TaxID=1429043 RepID=A0A0D2GE61_9BACT|nr:hypothetical protein X474_15045 [Dethiosulfatarculus sandiegensis]